MKSTNYVLTATKEITIGEANKMKKDELKSYIETFIPEIELAGSELVADLKVIVKDFIKGGYAPKEEVEAIEVQNDGKEEEVVVVATTNKKNSIDEKKKANNKANRLASLGRVIIDSNESDYTVSVGEWDIEIDRKPTGDVIKDLKVAYMYIASSVDILEGDMDFQSDLEVMAYDVMNFIKEFGTHKEKLQINRWIEVLEDTADESIKSWIDEEYEDDVTFEEDEIEDDNIEYDEVEGGIA